MFLVVDSNVLLNYPQILQDEENEIVLITDVLKELDGLKKSENGETAFKARRAAIVISRNIGKIMFVNEYDKIKMTVDDKLLAAAETYGETGCLITNDVYLKVQATLRGIPTKGYGGMEDYSGVIEWIVDYDKQGYNSDLEQLFQTLKPPPQYPMKENEYLIIRDGRDNKVTNIFIYINGKLEEVHYHEIRNKWIGKIKPRPDNPEQVCLFDALNRKNITIVYAGGSFGVGKSTILNNYALQELEHGNIQKIVYVPNNAYVANSMEIGLLPG